MRQLNDIQLQELQEYYNSDKCKPKERSYIEYTFRALKQNGRIVRLVRLINGQEVEIELEGVNNNNGWLDKSVKDNSIDNETANKYNFSLEEEQENQKSVS